MASIRDLKKRITSTNNTRMTTRAMKLVSAAKLRRAQEAIQANRPYARQIQRILRSLVSETSEEALPEILRSTATGEGQKPSLVLVLVSSDRGLCGGFNAMVIKGAKNWISQNQARYTKIQLVLVGKRVIDGFRNDKTTELARTQEFGGKVTFARAKDLSDFLVNGYLSGEFQEVRMVYNEFKNAISQVLTVEPFLPFNSDVLNAPSMTKSSATGSTAVEVSAIAPLIKPSAPEVLSQLMKQYFSTQAFRIMLESQASEHGARMSAMENATKNAGEMIKKLTLQYNKQRQASITKELLEIISGSESQKNSA